MPKIAIVLLVLAGGAFLRLPTFGRALLSDDEAIYAATADAMARGELLYRDVVDHKPPLVYHVYRAGFAAFGAYQTHGAHLFVVLAALATGALLWRLGGARGAGLGAAVLWLVFSTTWHDYDALAANCELFLLAPQAAAAWLALAAYERGPRGWRFAGAHLAIGLLVGVSALFKYQGITFLGASGGLLVLAVLRRRHGAPAAVAALGLELAGAVVPALAYLLAARAEGSAEAALTWFRFNFLYVGAGLSGAEAVARGGKRLLLIGGVALVPYALGLAAAATTARALVQTRGAARAGHPEAVDVLGLLWLGSAAVAVSAGGRFFGHYFHLALAPLALLAAPRVLALWRQSPARRWVLSFLVAAPALAFFALATFARPVAAALDHGEPPYERVAARLQALAPPHERVFVWGNSPQLYVLARRPMGARFSFCNYMTGESPGTGTETGEKDADANVLAASWAMLLEDLERRRPLLFVDAAAAGWDGYDKFPIARYPRLAEYLGAHYRVAEAVDGVVIYRRLP